MFHSLRRLPLRRGGHVGVGVQGEAGFGVAQNAGQGLGVYSAGQGVGSESVPQIVGGFLTDYPGEEMRP